MRNKQNVSMMIFLLLMLWMSADSIRSQGIANWFVAELLMIPGIVIGLSFHEFAHAFASDKLGDPLPKLQGRVTINPMAHIDWTGFLALIFVGFGWGKPVEINSRNYKRPRRDEFIVAFAGVLMNLVLAIVFTLILKVYLIGFPSAFMAQGTLMGIIGTMIYNIILINLVLMIFNLIPIPSLDGFNIITQIFDLKKYSWWYQLYQYGFFILLALILFNFTGRILTPGVNFFWNILSSIL